MKKIIFSIFLLILTSNSIGQNMGMQIKVKVRPTTVIITSADYQAPAINEQSMAIATASSFVNNYNPAGGDHNKIPQYFFKFSVSDILNYINFCEQSCKCDIPAVHFILGEDNADQNLYLFISLVNQNGYHYYYQASGDASCKILCSMGQTTGAAVQLAQIATFGITGYFSEAMTRGTANNYIANYFGDAQKNSTPLSWLYSADDLYNYLMNAGTTNLEFILAEASPNSPAQLIIVALDTNNNPMYFQYGNNACVMENCNPCPTCVTSALIDPDCNH